MEKQIIDLKKNQFYQFENTNIPIHKRLLSEIKIGNFHIPLESAPFYLNYGIKFTNSCFPIPQSKNERYFYYLNHAVNGNCNVKNVNHNAENEIYIFNIEPNQFIEDTKFDYFNNCKYLIEFLDSLGCKNAHWLSQCFDKWYNELFEKQNNSPVC